MNESLSRLGTSMEVIQNKINVLSNNVSNADTDYFKKDKVLEQSFQNILSNQDVSEMAKTLQINQRNEVFLTQPGVYVDGIYTIFEEGVLKESDDKNDISLRGEGFFVLENEEMNQNEYVRGGKFKIDQEGYLVNKQGKYLLDNENQRIFAATNKYTIDKNGSIQNAVGQVANAQVVSFDNLNALEKSGDGTYINNGGEDNIIQADANVLQGYKETSNVNLTDEITKLIKLTRNFETYQKTIQTIDEIDGKVSSELGRVY